MKRAEAKPSPEKDAERFDALCRHYRLHNDPDWSAPQTEKKWALLGRKLAEFVPAYKPDRRGRPPLNREITTDAEASELVSAGVSPFVARYGGADHLAAQFVLAITRIANNPQAAFRRLAGKRSEGRSDGMTEANRDRLKVDTRKWLLAKALPKIYGDKLTAEVTGKDGAPIEQPIRMGELARELAFIFNSGMDELEGKAPARSHRS